MKASVPAAIVCASLLCLGACRTVPVTDEDGNPRVDPETGEPETRTEFDQENAEGAAVAVAPFLPFPWNALLSGAAGIAATIRTNKDGESQ